MDIEIITDARGILACKMSKCAHSSLFRLSLELSQFNFSIRHIFGSENTLPDALTQNSGVDSTNGPPPMKLPEACKILELVKIPTNTVFSQAEVRKWLLDIGLLSLLKSDKKSKRTNLPISNASKITPQPKSLKNSKPVLLENNKFLIEKKVKSSKFANFFNLEQIKDPSIPFEDINLTNKVVVGGTLSIDDFSKLQKLCPEIKKMKNVVIHQNLHFKRAKNEFKIIIPSIVLKMYINNLHFSDRYLHLNDRNIFKIISKDFYYPKLFLYIRDIVGKCHICMLASKPILRKTPYKSFDYPSKPRVSWSFDLAGSVGSKLLFIAVCDFSLYAVIKTYESKQQKIS